MWLWASSGVSESLFVGRRMIGSRSGLLSLLSLGRMGQRTRRLLRITLSLVRDFETMRLSSSSRLPTYPQFPTQVPRRSRRPSRWVLLPSRALRGPSRRLLARSLLQLARGSRRLDKNGCRKVIGQDRVEVPTDGGLVG